MKAGESLDKISPSITVAISTIAENFDKFFNNFLFSSLKDAEEIVIIIQGEINSAIVDKLDKTYQIVSDEGKGISRSRNIGILNAHSQYIWFMDDDIILKDDAILTVKNNISQYKADIYTVRTEDIEDGNPYKNYPNRHRLNRRDIIGISSIEIIVSRIFTTQSQTRFNELLGLGTKYPSCEENIFLLDLYDLGAKIIHIPVYVQKHAHVDRRILFTDSDILYAKGVFCKRYGGLMGILIILFWFFRSLICGSNFRDCLNLIYGYNTAGTILK